MPKKKLSVDRIARILKAKHHEPIQDLFYYAPSHLSLLGDHLQERLKSKGGRPGVEEWQIVRKTRYSQKTWLALKHLAAQWSRPGASVSPAQVAAKIVEQAVSPTS